MLTTPELPLPRLSGGLFASTDDNRSPVAVLTDDTLHAQTGVRIAFTERAGGVSGPPYDSLNLASHVDDASADVQRNRQLLLHALGCPDAALIVPNQVHGTHIVAVDDAAPESIQVARDKAQEGADGLCVTCTDVAALLCFADCMPVIAVAPDASFCVMHAGWRGVVGGVVLQGLDALQRAGNRKEECNIYIGPYIHGECFQVGSEVRRTFVQAFGTDCLYDDSHVDLGAAMRISLMHAGISRERIADVDRCTVCNNDRFYSYRAQHGVCGRHGALAVRVNGWKGGLE